MSTYLCLAVACLLAAAYANSDVYIFNNGNCPNNNCCEGLTCSCDKDQIKEIMNNYTTSLAAASYTGPSIISSTNLQNLSYIGVGSGFRPKNCRICDHKVDWMAIYTKPFSTDGVMYEANWLINDDCTDLSKQSIKYGNVNKKILFGIAEAVDVNSCKFKVLGYVAKDRSNYADWDDYLKNKQSPSAKLEKKINFTPEDHIAMGLKVVDSIGNFNLKDKHFIYAYQDGGTVCYQKWVRSFTKGEGLHCMASANGNLVDLVGKEIDLSAETSIKRKYRRYNLQVKYGRY